MDNDIEALLANSPAPRVTPAQLDATIVETTYLYHKTLTICVLELRNGFLVTGESACADPANYNREIGNQIAYKNAREKIWALEGYLLKEALSKRAGGR